MVALAGPRQVGKTTPARALPTCVGEVPAHRLRRIFSFELKEEVDCFDFLNRLEIVVSSSKLGDNRTLAIPVAQTIFWEMGPERRKDMGIAESLIRISTGIEDCEGLVGDFRQALGYGKV